ncbi:MAG: YaiO family outer membrane beta-barrel protein [Bacteroidales bacterium]|nr:YaiO family outer membrane beta-barrel protein [Bacteroidales bacterium]HPE21433.1 YaiO family outer membrane beta-barrel protein [Bacteroidales bacterium]
MSLVMMIMTAGLLSGQTITNPEEEYGRVRALALEGRYDEAEPAARLLVGQYPDYGDARVLLGRIIAWQGRYEEGAAVIDTLLMTDPDNSDALEAVTDIRRWMRDRSQQFTLPTDIRAGYMFDTFNEPYERLWQVFSLGAGHRFSWGTAVAMVNLGHIIIGEPSPLADNDVQLAVEAWPELGSHNYAYLAYAYSPGPWFPRHRAAFELWQSLPAGWALSAGINYYYFEQNIFLGTASVEKYLGNYWFSARGYFHFKDIGVTTSFFLSARRYFNVTDYLQLTLGTGTAPDEPYDIITDLERQKASSARLTYFNQINSRWSFRIGAGYSYEKYNPSSYRNRFEGNIGLIMGIGKAE